MRKLCLVVDRSCVDPFAMHRSPIESAASAAFPHRQQDADRLQLRGRSLDRQPRRRRRSPPHLWRRHRRPSTFLSRRLHDRLHRRIRRQSRCLRRSRHWRHASPPDLSSRRRIRRRLDSRRQEDPLQLLGQQLHALRGSALHRPRRGRIPHASSSPHRRGRVILARWHAPRLRSASQVAASLEALPRRPDHSHLDRRSQRLQHRQDSPRQLQRSPSHVGRRYHLFSFRPQRSRQPLRLRHQDQASHGSSAQRRPRFQDRLGRTRRHRDRAVRRHQALRPRRRIRPRMSPFTSPATSRPSVRTSPRSIPSASRTSASRPPARAPSSKPGEKSSPFPPTRATFATSRAVPPSPIAIPRGRPTASRSLISPTSPANTNSPSAIRTAWAPFATSISAIRRHSSTRQRGRPTARRLPTPTSACSCGTSISTTRRPSSSTPTISGGFAPNPTQPDLVP